MRTYVSPIGYNSTSVVRPVFSRGLDSGDRVVLLRPNEESDEKRATNAIEDVSRLFGEIEPDVTLSTERITYDEYPTAVLECSTIIRSSEGDVIVNLGGGARDLLVPLTTAALVHAELISETLGFSDIDGSVRNVELPVVTSSVSDKVYPTLVEIATHPDSVSVPNLTDELDRSKSSITRHVSVLEEAGLVRSEKHGRTKIVELTFTGELHLRTRDDR